MKKIKLLSLFLSLFLIGVNVNAATANLNLKGTTTIKLGNTTTINVVINSSDVITGAGLKYTTSGDINVTSVKIGSGFVNQGVNGTKYALTANGVKSGSTVLQITIKGTKQGSGTLTLSGEASIGFDFDTVELANKSVKITVNPAKTQAEIEAERAEQERLEEEKKNAIKKATTLVEAAEKSLLDDDYEAALEAVTKLDDSDEKENLQERLENVRFKMAVQKECANNNNECQKCENVECEKCNTMPWMILSIVAVVVLIIESTYLIIKTKKED